MFRATINPERESITAATEALNLNESLLGCQPNSEFFLENSSSLYILDALETSRMFFQCNVSLARDVWSFAKIAEGQSRVSHEYQIYRKARACSHFTQLFQISRAFVNTSVTSRFHIPGYYIIVVFVAASVSSFKRKHVDIDKVSRFERKGKYERYLEREEGRRSRTFYIKISMEFAKRESLESERMRVRLLALANKILPRT